MNKSQNKKVFQSTEIQIAQRLNFSVFILFAFLWNVQPISSENTKDFIPFWQDFRQMVISKDFQKIQEHVKFPLQTRSTLDESPIVKFQKKDFPKLFKEFLKQMSGLNPTNLNETESEFINRKDTLDLKKDQLSGTEARIGNMVFQKQKGKWKLKFLYLEEDSYNSLKKQDD